MLPRVPVRAAACVAVLVPALVAVVWSTIAWATDGAPTAATPASAISLPVAAALGAVQGATEFLPVSSSGHLSLAQAFFGVDPQTGGHRFSIVAHAGTLLAVVWMYRRDVLALARVLLRPTEDSNARRTLLMMVVATLPLGLVLVPGVEDAIIYVERHPQLVGACLLVTATILLLAFRRPSEAGVELDPDPPPPPSAVVIGLAQLMAVLPGISRSGSTIAAALAVGETRTAAARFSFLISIPAILGATVLELRKLGEEAGAVDILPYLVGFLVSFGVGLACLGLLLRLVRSGRIGGFVVYLVVVGTAAIVWGG